jgi:ribosomal-protein-alanine N-acetyltransferase
MPETEHLLLRPVTVADAPAFLDYYTRNSAYLERWEPARPDDFYTVERQRDILETHVRTAAEGGMQAFAILPKDDPRTLAGRIAIDNIVRGVFQSATVGYSIDQAHTGKGYATEAVAGALEFAFKVLQLHRIQAGTMISNERSQRVLLKNRFRHEGTALRYLNINGRWEDHHLYAITSEEW